MRFIMSQCAAIGARTFLRTTKPARRLSRRRAGWLNFLSEIEPFAADEFAEIGALGHRVLARLVFRPAIEP